MSESPAVRVERDGPVTTVILSRPDVRNAVDRPTAVALADAFLAFERDNAAQVAVFTGDHGTFCAGADLKAISAGLGNRVEEPATGSDWNPLGVDGPMGPSRMLLSKPVIAAVSGYAVAGGFELALWCDLRVVEEDAVFGVFCRRWGVPLVDGGTVRLPRIVGIRALVFDLDGLILDTESVVYASWESAYRNHGVPLPLDLWHLAIGSDETHFEPLSYLLARRPDLDVEALQAQRRVVRDQLLSRLTACAGVPERIAEAGARGLRLAVASSSERAWVEHHLDRLGLRAHFSALRCREDVARVKPDPTLYRAALEALEVEPEQAVAFEDSPNGVAAAIAAGMRCVAIPGPMTRGLSFEAAHLCLASLAELPLDEILARVAA